MNVQLFSIFLLFFFCAPLPAQNHYKTETGTAYFISDAPLEVIEAESEALRGIIDVEKKSFAFSISLRSFDGFNSPLQKEHFNENYIESRRYPNATFQGKIIEQTDLTKNGTYIIRAKGILDIHGVKQERIIKSEVVTNNGEMTISSFFTVLLNEHDIMVPRIVYQKIAEEIQVKIRATLKSDNH